MTLTDKNLFSERPNLGGIQRRYRVGDYGLSLVNAKMLHHYEFAWEAAVLKFDDKGRHEIVYDTPLTDNVEVFSTDDEANAFIEKAFAWFREQVLASRSVSS